VIVFPVVPARAAPNGSTSATTGAAAGPVSPAAGPATTGAAAAATDAAGSATGTGGLPAAAVATDAVTRSLRRRVPHRSGPARWVAASIALSAVGALVMSSGGSVNPQSAAALPRPAAAAAKGPLGAASPVEIRVDAAPAIAQRPLPAGWTWYQHPDGFRAAVPANWPLVMWHDVEAYFCEPDGARMVVVSPMDLEGREPAEALLHEETEDPLKGYERLRIGPTSYRGGAADVEYLYNDPKRGRMRGLNRSFVVGDKAYLIEWRTLPGDWDRNLPTFNLIASSFDAPRAHTIRAE
jgi:hypothetical protein